MPKHDDTHDLTVKEFFEEYGMLVFFGTFFLMTMFLPLLFLDKEHQFWLPIGIGGVVGVIVFLVVCMKLLSQKKKA